MNIKTKVSLQLAGVLAISVGAFMVAIWLGLMIAGIFLLAIGTGQPEKLTDREVIEKDDDS
ncbi:hypothetical protein [Amycolatopsis sp. NPDC003731]